METGTEFKAASSIPKRLYSQKNMKRIHDLDIYLKNVKNPIEGILYAFDVINDIKYDDIRNGLILSFNDLWGFLTFYNENKKKNKYISWLLNTYYKSSLNRFMEIKIKKEMYEDASLIRDALLVTEMPLVKE